MFLNPIPPRTRTRTRTRHALLRARSYRVLIGACNPMSDGVPDPFALFFFFFFFFPVHERRRARRSALYGARLLPLLAAFAPMSALASLDGARAPMSRNRPSQPPPTPSA